MDGSDEQACATQETRSVTTMKHFKKKKPLPYLSKAAKQREAEKVLTRRNGRHAHALTVRQMRVERGIALLCRVRARLSWRSDAGLVVDVLLAGLKDKHRKNARLLEGAINKLVR